MFWDGRHKIEKKMQALEEAGWQVERQMSPHPKWNNLNWTVKKFNVLVVIHFTKRGKVSYITGSAIKKFNDVDYYHPFDSATKNSFLRMLTSY